jgi:alpha-ketoglutarate-dependent taurine dioxygenase
MKKTYLSEVEKEALFNDGVILLSNVNRNDVEKISKILGSLIVQYDGSVMWDITADDLQHTTYYSKRMDAIPPHTDGHDLLIPPKYLALYCCHPDVNNTGVTEVCDAHKFMLSIKPSEKGFLSRHSYEFESKSLAQTGRKGVVEPIYNEANNVFRYSENYLKRQATDDVNLNNIIGLISGYNKKNARKLLLKSRELAIVNNHRMWHSRTAFTDSNRHLIRVWIG